MLVHSPGRLKKEVQAEQWIDTGFYLSLLGF